MLPALSLAALSLALGVKADDAQWPDYTKFGNMFYSGPTSNGAYITKTAYSMVPPATPCGYHDGTKEQEELALWIGVQADPTGKDVMDMNFVEPLLNWAPDQSLTGCNTDVDHWCIAASTYTPQGQQGQTYVEVPSDSQIDFTIFVDSDNKVNQTAWVNGAVISTQADSAGLKPAVFYSGNECSLYSCGTLDGYSWSNITLHLSEADEKFGDTFTLTGATSTGAKTSDGGKTWTVEEIKINKDYLYVDGSKTDCSSS
ncbi:hypothetical protein GTA08_BOTSDO03764 [Botryosphaeria dothidea]|uniref:Uncharacterized protein n=1 Tax=Botryosphaeria dothidea TaxID=55169 RepID=A0A8H4IV63_9PEZI|nr:hypothetical protein GTA08_BOTSDO03764 [Botryosphaeria dothidea]